MNIKEAQEQLQQLADELKAELGAPEEWPQKDDYYWTIDMSLTRIYQAKQRNSDLDCFRQSIGWVWRSSVEAQKHLDMLQATERVNQYITKANKDADWMADFNDKEQQKATWECLPDSRQILLVRSWRKQGTDTWRYIKPALYDQLIEDCEADIKIIMGVEEWRDE